MSTGFEYWLVAGTSGSKSDDKLKFDLQSLADNKGNQICNVSSVNVPEFKVGTLDSLVTLSDELVKHDQTIDGIVRKLAFNLQNLLVDHPEKLGEALTFEGVELNKALEDFQWDGRKYFLKNSLVDIVDEITRRVGEIDQELKSRQTNYTQIKNNLNVVERSASGSLLSRSLAEIVKREHVVLGSEYLTTLFVVVPASMDKEWLASYQKLTDMVVPESSQLIASDSEYCLFSVTLFKRIVDDFKNAARENKFVVRDFQYDPNLLEEKKKEERELNANMTKQWASFVRWACAHFSEAFSCWVHIKIVTIFVESILRFGLPPTFKAFLIRPNKKMEKKTRSILGEVFQHLETNISKNSKEEEIDIQGIQSAAEFFPYVSLTFNSDFLTVKRR